MKRKIYITALLGVFSLLLLTAQTSAQCVVINEILINGPGGADGQAPNSEEWIELYNTCNIDIDLSCYALADGDFVIRFPAGSTIPANGYFTIGSPNSAIPLDLNQFACGCTNPANQGIIFTNGAEQVVLMDNNGLILDALIWGGGQGLPFTVSSSPVGCNAINATVSNGNANFETLPPTNNDNGCVCARECDGSPNWEVRCGAAISAGTTNGNPFIVDFDASASNICQGDCISFNDLTVGGATSWTWTFEGASIPNSSLQNPTNICYNTPGSFDVTLTATDGCSTATLTVPDFIQVGSSLPPVITASGPTSFCVGDEVTLTASPIGNNYQWFENQNPINGATSNSLVVTTSGIYSVADVNNSCADASAATNVVVFEFPIVTITAEGPTQICTGQTVTLSTSINGDFQWLESGNILTGEDAASFVATEAGFYSLQATVNGCTSESNIISVEEITSTTVVITTTDDVLCPDESAILNVNSTETNFIWYLNNEVIVGESGATINTDITGTYSAEIVNPSCPVTVTPITILAGALPNATITPDGLSEICPGNTINLTLVGTFASFEWTLNEVPFNTSSTNINVSDPGVYAALLISADGCSAPSANQAEVSVVTPEIISVVSSEGNSICEGAFTNLTATPNFTNYEWTLNGNPIANTSNSLINQGIGIYAVNALDNNGCEVSENITIAQIPSPIITLNPGDDVIICAENVTITATGGTVYQWFFNNNIITGANSNSLVANQSGNYYAASTNAQGCPGISESISVFLEGTFEFEINEPSTTVCEGGTITLSLPEPFSSYLWSTGETTSTITVNESSTYTVEVTNDQGCAASDAVNVNFIKIPEIELVSSFRSDCVNGVEVVAISEGLISWEVSPFITLLDNNRIIANPESTSSYSVTSTIGICESQTDFEILVECPTLFIPNVFTPNDDGVNDFFRIEGENLGLYEMIIFNRWGDEIYRSNNINRGWNGGINGYYAPDGTYNYIIKIFDLSGQPLFGKGEFYGTVTLLR
jgi:gliding motility-associated-like protein